LETFFTVNENASFSLIPFFLYYLLKPNILGVLTILAKSVEQNVKFTTSENLKEVSKNKILISLKTNSYNARENIHRIWEISQLTD